MQLFSPRQNRDILLFERSENNDARVCRGEKRHFLPVNTSFYFFIFTLLIFQPDTFREDNRNDDVIVLTTLINSHGYLKGRTVLFKH